MSSAIQRVGIVAKHGLHAASEHLTSLDAWLRHRGIEPVYEAETALLVEGLARSPVLSREALPNAVDLVAVLGGDGTLLAMAARPALAPRLGFMAKAGRMALTNYLIQIAVVDVLFSGYGAGLGRIRPLFGFALALSLFALQCVLSAAWLREFRYGPAEWLWRSATYGKWQPTRR